MDKEVSRQLIHASGILFIILAQFTGGLFTALYFFMISLSFLLYSEYVRKEERRLHGLMKAFESRFRGLAAGFERKSAARPFAGAIWFYFSCGLAFLVFPLPVASAAGAVLAVGDSFSTLVGLKFGRRRVVGRKTLEGVLAFFAISLPVSLFFVGMCPAFFGSLAATIAELIPDMKKLENLKKRGWMDDNLLIPLAAGAVMLLSSST